MYVCSCRAVTDSQVEAAVMAGACSVGDLTRYCGAGGGCGGCHEVLSRILALADDPAAPRDGVQAA